MSTTAALRDGHLDRSVHERVVVHLADRLLGVLGALVEHVGKALATVGVAVERHFDVLDLAEG